MEEKKKRSWVKSEAKRQLNNCSDFYVKGQTENFVSIQTSPSSNQYRATCTHGRRIRSRVRRLWTLFDFSTHCKTARNPPRASAGQPAFCVVRPGKGRCPGEQSQVGIGARILNAPSESANQLLRNPNTASMRNDVRKSK